MNTTTLSAKARLAALLVLAALVGCGAKKPEDHLQAAKAALGKKDPKTATIEVKNALQLNPELAEARFLLGAILLKERNASAAELEFRKAASAGFASDLVVPELAKTMLELNQYKKLIDEFGKTQLSKASATAALQTSLAIAYETMGSKELAQAALGAARQADPDYTPAVLTEARQKAAQKDLAEASRMVDAVLAKHADNTEAWKLRGDLWQASNDPAAAIAAYRKALEADHKNAAAHFAAVSMLARQGKLDDASQQLEKFKSASPGVLSKYLETQMQYAKGDHKGARDSIQQLLRNQPNNAMFLQMAGAIELQLNSNVQAEIYLSRALQTSPNLPLARRLLISTQVRSGQSGKALAGLNALTNNGKTELDPSLYSLAGEVYLQNGDAAKAEAYFAKALKQNPGNVGTRTALAVSRLARGDEDGAFAELQDAAAADQGATADLALISALLKKGDHAKALAAIDKLEAKEPKNPRASNLRGRVQLAKKDLPAARLSFEKALATDPSSFAAASSLAALDLADKKPDAAKRRFEALLAKNPKDAMALLALARLAVDGGANQDEVNALFDKAIEANPADATPRLVQINHLLKTKNHKLAVDAAQKALAALPNSLEVMDALGRAQRASGDMNQAAATFGKLATAMPLSPGPQMRLASLHMANKDPAAAEQSLRRALEIKPDLLEAQNDLMVVLLASKKYPQALAVAKSIQSQRPKEAIGFGAEGDIHVAQRNQDAGIAAYRAALQRLPAPELAIKLHVALVSTGKAVEIDKFTATWLKDHPKDAAFLLHLGDTALQQKDLAGAERRYQQALSLKPDNGIVLNNLAWVTGQLGKEGAVAYAEKAMQVAPNQPAFMDTLAMLLAKKNDTAKATELLTKALSLQPQNHLLRLNLAKVHIQAGNKVQAKAELETLQKQGNRVAAHAEVETLLKSL